MLGYLPQRRAEVYTCLEGPAVHVAKGLGIHSSLEGSLLNLTIGISRHCPPIVYFVIVPSFRVRRFRSTAGRLCFQVGPAIVSRYRR